MLKTFSFSVHVYLVKPIQLAKKAYPDPVVTSGGHERVGKPGLLSYRQQMGWDPECMPIHVSLKGT